VKSLPVESQRALSIASVPEKVQQLCGKEGEMAGGMGWRRVRMCRKQILVRRE